MKPKWLIVEDCFADDLSPLLDALKRNNIEYKTILSTAYYDTENKFLGLFKPNDCVIFYGSLEMAKRVKKKASWVPGVYCDLPKYNCITYYAALGKYLLNDNYIMLPWGDLLRQKEFLYEKLSSDRAIFLRPNRGDKIFTGQVIYKEKFEEIVDRLNTTGFSNEEIVIASEPRNLAFEWRFVSVNGNIVSGSQYKANNIVGGKKEYPSEALEFANEIAFIYNPEDCYVIDVCLTKSGQYRLVEVGSFSCAGLYQCDRDAVVKEVSNAALKDWDEINEY